MAHPNDKDNLVVQHRDILYLVHHRIQFVEDCIVATTKDYKMGVWVWEWVCGNGYGNGNGKTNANGEISPEMTTSFIRA
jgi:hypothetical protein